MTGDLKTLSKVGQTTKKGNRSQIDTILDTVPPCTQLDTVVSITAQIYIEI